jgi:hypothetical protein
MGTGVGVGSGVGVGTGVGRGVGDGVAVGSGVGLGVGLGDRSEQPATQMVRATVSRRTRLGVGCIDRGS